MQYKIHSSEIEIKYHLLTCKKPSKNLVVVFPGARLRTAASFPEYFMQLNSYGKINALFFVDEYVEGNTAPYILKDGDNVVERSFMSLVKRIVEELNIENIIAIGQSGGGCAALYYGMKYNWYVISSSPSFMWNLDEKKFINKKNEGDLRLFDSFSYSTGGMYGEYNENLLKIHNNQIATSLDGDYNKKIFILNGKFEPNKNDTLKLIDIILNKGFDLEVIWRKYSNHADCYILLEDKLFEILDFITDNKKKENLFLEKKRNSDWPLSDGLCIIHKDALESVDSVKKYRRLFRVKINNPFGKYINIKFFKFEANEFVNFTLFFDKFRASVEVLEGKGRIGKLHFLSNLHSNQKRKWAEIWIEKTDHEFFRGSFSIEYSSAFLSYDDFDTNQHIANQLPYKQGVENFMDPFLIDGIRQIPLINNATCTSSGAMSAEDKVKLDELYFWFKENIKKIN